MTQKNALKMRAALDCILSFNKDGRFKVAIVKRYPDDNSDDWEVHLYISESWKSGYISLAVLAQGIESITTDFLSCESSFDAGTSKGENIVQSVKIW